MIFSQRALFNSAIPKFARQINKPTLPVASSINKSRFYANQSSSKPPLTTVEIRTLLPAEDDLNPAKAKSLPGFKYAVINMNRAPVNSLDDNLMTSLRESINDVHNRLIIEDPEIKGLVLSSAISGFFCAGIDLKMFKSGVEKWSSFWGDIRRVSFLIYTSPLLTIANVNGHAPGGGTVLALACNKRVMTRGKANIGLNEVQVGLPVPGWITDMFIDCCGMKAARDLLPVGAQMGADSAKEIGLVDKVVNSEEESWQEVENIFRTVQPLNMEAVKHTYGFINRRFVERFQAEGDADMEYCRGFVADPKYQMYIDRVVASLNKRKKK
eukprot:Nk52_evm38s2579 gene=Nk52_evmTU38s2579